MKGVSRCLVLSLAGTAIFFLAAGQLSAQSFTPTEGTALVRDAVPQAPATAAPVGAEAKVLVTDEAARVGVERSKSSEEVPASAAQTSGGTTMKWVIIIGLAVISALFILMLADIGNI